MSKITQLDQVTINKIAAGEVIERPAAVVKELVENAIDAGASAVTVEIKNGGISFIRVTDNGSGMAKSDVSTAFLRHATSKIKTVEDLLNVSSLGFRGEALSSIAAVSQVELITKTETELSGIRYVIEGGNEKIQEEIGCPGGSTFLIRNLFYNTPARRKFMRSFATEAGYINELMDRLASAHAEISFKFISNNQVRLHTSGNNNQKDIIYNIYGRDITRNLLAVNGHSDNCKITGFIGKPMISRGNRNYQNYYINGRYIKSSVINKAIEEAYKPYIMTHRYPFTVIHLQVGSEYLDVNVHPTKMEVRFTNSEEIYTLVFQTIRDALMGKELIPDVTLTKEREESKTFENAPEPFETVRRDELNQARGVGNASAKGESSDAQLLQPNQIHIDGALTEEAADGTLMEAASLKEMSAVGTLSKFSRGNRDVRGRSTRYEGARAPKIINPSADLTMRSEGTISNDHMDEIKEMVDSTEIGKLNQVAATGQVLKEEIRYEAEKTEESVQLDLFGEQLLTREARANHRIIGQVFSTYWIIEYSEKIFIIDQHAAHEKVLYEKMMVSISKKEFSSQMLHPPIIITLSLREEQAMITYMSVLNQIGFEIDHFGGKEYSVRAVPGDLLGIAQTDLLIELIDSLCEEERKENFDVVLERAASMSCKAAVKGNNRLSYMEASALIDQLLELENPYHCPHGRPTIISMSKHELEKKFKRIV